jgi:uncharacterized membrane protein YfhO
VRTVLDYREGSIDNPLTITRVANPGRYWFEKRSGRVLRVAESFNSATVDVETTETARLVITITRHKYWQATIDGHPTPLIPANIAYQGLSVPPGRHRVELRYRNPVVIGSAAVSAMALIVLTLLRRRPRIEF